MNSRTCRPRSRRRTRRCARPKETAGRPGAPDRGSCRRRDPPHGKLPDRVTDGLAELAARAEALGRCRSRAGRIAGAGAGGDLTDRQAPHLSKNTQSLRPQGAPASAVQAPSKTRGGPSSRGGFLARVDQRGAVLAGGRSARASAVGMGPGRSRCTPGPVLSPSPPPHCPDQRALGSLGHGVGPGEFLVPVVVEEDRTGRVRRARISGSTLAIKPRKHARCSSRCNGRDPWPGYAARASAPRTWIAACTPDIVRAAPAINGSTGTDGRSRYRPSGPMGASVACPPAAWIPVVPVLPARQPCARRRPRGRPSTPAIRPRPRQDRAMAPVTERHAIFEGVFSAYRSWSGDMRLAVARMARGCGAGGGGGGAPAPLDTGGSGWNTLTVTTGYH